MKKESSGTQLLGCIFFIGIVIGLSVIGVAILPVKVLVVGLAIAITSLFFMTRLN